MFNLNQNSFIFHHFLQSFVLSLWPLTSESFLGLVFFSIEPAWDGLFRTSIFPRSFIFFSAHKVLVAPARSLSLSGFLWHKIWDDTAQYVLSLPVPWISPNIRVFSKLTKTGRLSLSIFNCPRYWIKKMSPRKHTLSSQGTLHTKTGLESVLADRSLLKFKFTLYYFSAKNDIQLILQFQITPCVYVSKV